MATALMIRVICVTTVGNRDTTAEKRSTLYNILYIALGVQNLRGL